MKPRLVILGINLRYERRIRKLTGADIAKTIGVSPQTYSGYGTGRHEPTIETLVKLANLYDVTIDYLVGRA